MSPTEPSFPLLSVAAFIDKTTVALSGWRVAELSERDEVYVLGVGTTLLPNVDVPLVVPKVTLEIAANAGVYALAKSVVVEKTVTVPALGLVGISDMFRDQTKTVYRRNPIVDKADFVGNPAARPVAVGDVVIRKEDYARYVTWLKDNASS